jgi:predicted pyridoxine 5'-phosphate oxidase superfamily flavin-nucleotide-binding protein
MEEFYSSDHRRLQDLHDTRRLADAERDGILHSVFTEAERAFIGTRDMFFLSTVDHRGRPTVSYKGGAPGFVEFDGNDLVVPSYNGNGMFLSMGNILTNPEVGLLFIDFETPNRLRVQGRASLIEGTSDRHPGAEMLVRIVPTEIFVNCPRYIHRYRKVDESRHVPKPGSEQPLAAWKRIDYVVETLPEADRIRVAAEGSISQAEYDEMVRSGRV